MNKAETKIELAISECKKHIERLEYAKKNMKSLMPLTGKKYENLENEEVIYIDQFLYRFAKLQDAIGQKLIKSLYEVLGEGAENNSFRDVFDKLEQIGIIENYEEWNSLREIRNELSHEYGDDIKESATKLNMIYKMDKTLIKYFNDIENYYEKYKNKQK